MSIPGEPSLRSWRSFRWVGRWQQDAGVPTGGDLDEATERYTAESRARRSARMPLRDRLVSGTLAASFLTAAVATAALVPTHRAPAAATVALLVLAYAFASRVDVEMGAGSAVPTGLVLIPMLFVLPVGQVPLWVAAGYLLGAAPGYLTGREHPERASILLTGCWHAIGPTLVLAVAGEGQPRLSRVPLYLGALGAQLALDGGSALVRDRLVRGVGYRELLGYLSRAYLIDVCLAPVGLAFAIAIVALPAGAVLLFPLLFLMQSFARERSARIDQALELGAAYRGTGKLAEMYHELLAAPSLDATLERIADTLSELIAVEGVQVVETNGSDERTLLARGRLTGTRRVERSVRRKDESETETALKLTVFPGDGVSLDADELQLVGWFADASAVALEGARLKERLTHQARTDSLTGLINHGTFQEQLRSDLQFGREHQQPLALVMLDIDDFKRINDVHGHGVGDDVLKMVALTLAEAAGSDAHVCRVGGEEFTLIMPGCGSAVALDLAERIRTGIAGRRVGSLGRVTVSVGVAEAPTHARSARELVGRADDAMMAAKARGKDRAVVYDATRSDDQVGVQRERRRRSLAHLRMLQSLTGKLNRLNDVHQIGDAIVSELRTLIDYHSCRVYVTKGTVLAPIARYGELAYAEESFESLVLEIGEGIAGTAAAEARSLLIPDTDHCAFAVQVPGTEDVAESVIAVPLVYEHLVTGVVVVSKLGLDQFDQDDVRLLEVLAGHASVAIENARLYQEVRQEAAGIEHAFVSTVDALANALEATDAQTSSHARAVKDLALAIGRKLDLDQPRMKTLELGALLHDIGKIGIPSELLNKPGPLTPDERRLVEQHPQIGERILQPIERLESVRPIVRHCHERWDGAGYPDRLAGNDIPLEARIIFRGGQLSRDDERPPVPGRSLTGSRVRSASRRRRQAVRSVNRRRVRRSVRERAAHGARPRRDRPVGHAQIPAGCDCGAGDRGSRPAAQQTDPSADRARASHPRCHPDHRGRVSADAPRQRPRPDRRSTDARSRTRHAPPLPAPPDREAPAAPRLDGGHYGDCRARLRAARERRRCRPLARPALGGIPDGDRDVAPHPARALRAGPEADASQGRGNRGQPRDRRLPRTGVAPTHQRRTEGHRRFPSVSLPSLARALPVRAVTHSPGHNRPLPEAGLAGREATQGHAGGDPGREGLGGKPVVSLST